MEEEEAGEAEVADRRQLLLEPPLGLGAAAVRPAVALAEPRPADLGELAVGARVLGAGVAVAELLGQVEAQPLGEAHGLGDRLGVLGEARRHPPPARRAPSSSCRGAAARRPPASSPAGPRRRRPGGGRGEGRGSGRCRSRRRATPSRSASRGEPAVAGAVAAPVGPLQLDPEAVAAEGLQQPPAEPRAAGAPRRAPRRPPAAPSRAQPERQTSPSACSSTRSSVAQGCPALRCGAVAGVGVGGGQQPAEVAVAGLALDQQGQVGAALEGQLGAGDRPHAEAPAGDARTPSTPRPRRGR